MSPLAFLTGVIAGSAVAITIGLAMVLVVFLFLSGEQPRLANEYGTLLRSLGLFALLAAVAGWAFVGLLKHRRSRWYAQAATWLAIAAIAFYYWPR